MTDFAPHTADPGPTDRRELIVIGEVDLHTAPAVERDGAFALAEPEVTTLAVDLNGVTFIDSTGIGVLVRLRIAAGEEAKHLVLLQPSEAVQRVLQVTGLQDVFTIEHSDPSA